MRRNQHQRRNRNYYVVPYIFNDEGRREERFVRVPKGCKLLYDVRFKNYNTPSMFKGHEIVGWVHVYYADDAEGDEYAPIIRLKKERRGLSFFPALFRFLDKITEFFITLLVITFIILLVYRWYNPIPTGSWQPETFVTPFETFVKPEKPTIEISELELQTYDLINKERAKQNLPLLNWNSRVAEVARSYSAYIANQPEYRGARMSLPKLSHTADGRTVNQRLQSGGVFFTSAGENLVPVPLVSMFEQRGEWIPARYYTQKQLAEEAVKSWMGSTGHRENILHSEWEDTGIGIATDDTQTNYVFTQDFISASCSSGTRLCNGECWQGCGKYERWVCTPNGAVCQQ